MGLPPTPRRGRACPARNLRVLPHAYPHPREAPRREPTMRRFPIGAELHGHAAHFRVWAPKRKRVEVLLDASATELTPEPGGYFSGAIPDLTHGARYRFRLDGGDAFADPASRFQP